MADNQQTAPPVPPIPPPPYYMYKRRTRWWIPVAIIGGIIVIGIIFITIIVASIGSSLTFNKETFVMKSNSVLELDLGKVVSEYPSGGPFDFLKSGSNASFLDIIEAIKRAKDDSRIEGIYYKASGAQLGFAKAKEIQDALADFKTSGKFIYAFIETGREMDYYLALPADKIFTPREGLIEINGYGASSVFLKGLFAKLGVDYYVLGFEDFKSAGEQLSRNNFSDSAKKQLRVILQQRYDMFSDAVAKYRKLDKEKVKAVMDRGVYTADSLLALGFVDSLMTETSVKEMLKDMTQSSDKNKKGKHKLNLVSIGNYVNTSLPGKQKLADKSKQIAIIYGVGPVMDEAGGNPFSSGSMITPKVFIKNLKKAREDDNIKLIIIRIDSPGGSVIASDNIWEEIQKTKKVKPVYASMSDVAASGGYYIPVACDTIIAHEATITGSIGVILAIPNISRLLNKIDVGVDTISTGKSSQFMNTMYPFSDKDKEKLYTLAKGVYDRFLNKVAEARHKTYDEVRAIAKGRVWTGEDAYKLGLVDVLGGIETSIALAKKRIGIPEDTKVRVQIFPRREEGIAELLKMFGIDNGEDDEEESYSNADYTKALSEMLNIKQDNVMQVYNSMPDDFKRQANYFLNLFYMSKHERALMALPYYIDGN